MMLRDTQVQALFEGYDLEYNKSSIRKRSLRSTNHTDTEQVSLRGSCKWCFNNIYILLQNQIENLFIHIPFFD